MVIDESAVRFGVPYIVAGDASRVGALQLETEYFVRLTLEIRFHLSIRPHFFSCPDDEVLGGKSLQLASNVWYKLLLHIQTCMI